MSDTVAYLVAGAISFALYFGIAFGAASLLAVPARTRVIVAVLFPLIAFVCFLLLDAVSQGPGGGSGGWISLRFKWREVWSLPGLLIMVEGKNIAAERQPFKPRIVWFRKLPDGRRFGARSNPPPFDPSLGWLAPNDEIQVIIDMRNEDSGASAIRWMGCPTPAEVFSSPVNSASMRVHGAETIRCCVSTAVDASIRLLPIASHRFSKGVASSSERRAMSGSSSKVGRSPTSGTGIRMAPGKASTSLRGARGLPKRRTPSSFGRMEASVGNRRLIGS